MQIVKVEVTFVISKYIKYLYFFKVNSCANKNQSLILSFYGSNLKTYKSQRYSEITPKTKCLQEESSTQITVSGFNFAVLKFRRFGNDYISRWFYFHGFKILKINMILLYM